MWYDIEGGVSIRGILQLESGIGSMRGAATGSDDA